MASLEDIRAERLKKLDSLKAAQIDPYPISTKRDYSLATLGLKFETIQKKAKPISIAGRIKARRGQGAISFIDIDDGTGSFQLVLKRDNPPAGLGQEGMTRFQELTDVGDFVSATGTLFTTNKNEPSLMVTDWRMLGKSLRPLPDKWHGLQDVEERFRHRYLDTLMNPEVKSRFLLRVRMIQEIRRFFNKAGFVEVEVPYLQPLAGGANARPFTTHHNALATDFYLPIAQELYLKQLLVGGFSKVYEIGRRFRNEGIDVMHNPEFTMLESNEAYTDAKKMMAFTEQLLKYVVKELFGQLTIAYNGQTIDFAKKFTVIKFHDLLRRYALMVDPENISRKEAAVKADQLGVVVSPEDSLEKILDNIYKKMARGRLIQPTYVVDYPVGMNPFAKRKPEDPKLIDRFQLIVGGVEIVKAFSETNNPLDQRERYLEEDKKGQAGEQEISPSDLEYLEAMEYGMPPNGGIGIGIDRLAMILTDTKNIKEVILFPTMRPKTDPASNLDSNL